MCRKDGTWRKIKRVLLASVSGLVLLGAAGMAHASCHSDAPFIKQNPDASLNRPLFKGGRQATELPAAARSFRSDSALLSAPLRFRVYSLFFPARPTSDAGVRDSKDSGPTVGF